jgi:hypothetical protein
MVSIPNIELMMVWKEFILEKLFPDLPQIKTLFDNIDRLDIFARDIEYFLCDRLSYVTIQCLRLIDKLAPV